MNREDILLKELENTFQAKKIIEIINKDGVTPNVLRKALNITSDENVLLEILCSNALTKVVFEELFDKRTHYISFSEVDIRIINHTLFTREMYDYYVGKIRNIHNEGVIKSLIESKYANESSYIMIINNTLELSEDNYQLMLSSTKCTEKVLETLINKKKALGQCLENRYLTPALLKKIIDIGTIHKTTYRDVVIKALSNPLMTKELLIEIMNEKGDSFLYEFGEAIIESPKADEDALLMFELGPSSKHTTKIAKSEKSTPKVFSKIIKENSKSYSSQEKSINILLAIVNNPVVKAETIKEIIKVQKEHFTSYTLININSQIHKRIIDLPVCTEEILAMIVNSTADNSVLEKVNKSPLAGKQVQVETILKKTTLSDEDIKSFLSIDGLNVEDMIKLVKRHPKEKNVISAAIDYEDATASLYREVVEAISKNDNSTTKKELIEKLLEKNIPEFVLVEIVKKNFSYELLTKAMSHKNANLHVVDAVLTIVNNYQDEQKQTLIDASIDLKKRIIASIYTIEEEENATEILRQNIEDGLSTMVWGKSGVGKSSRVLEIDPTTTMLILKNGMLPEEVIGGKEPNGEPGEIYPPHWYVLLCEKCRKEPERKHVLFIDEFTNVSDTIKNLVWEIIGSRLVNGHEEWPLPENCSIVVAGNRPEESSAVRIDSTGGVMPAPLHNRIDSMIEIEFDIDEWQKWALETDYKTEKLRMHPIVYSFCVSHADKVMFTNFDPENITQPYLSPRKWESLSKAIYKAEERGARNHISYRRIISIIGNNDIARAFIAHYERLPIDMNKIENGEYMEEDFPSVEDKLYALGIVIAQYEGSEIAIEDFIINCLGDEYLSVYNNMKNVKDAVIEQKTNAQAKRS